MKEAPIFPVVLVAAAVTALVLCNDDDGSLFIRGGKAIVERPVVNIPPKLRQGNWLRRGTRADGSCCHASLISLLRWQGQHTLADRWRRTHSGGEFTWTMQEALDEAGIPYAWCTNGDERFLEWSIRTRRGACIQYMDSPSSTCYHMVNVVDLTDNWVCLLDNNDPRRFKWMKRDQFMRNWKQSKGWAFTPVYSPAAPLPPHHRRDMP